MVPSSSNPKPVTEARETRLLVKFGFELARELEIDKVLVIAELLTDRRLVEKHRGEATLIWVTQNRFALADNMIQGEHCIEIPQTRVDRMDQVALALMIAVLNSLVDEVESVVCLVGVAGSKRLDNLLIANPKRDFSWFSRNTVDRGSQPPVTQEFVRLIEIALKFASEGREGKSIGTMLLLGDVDAMQPFAKPLILNPCEGHPRKARSIHDPEFVETMREFSALDGAFLIDSKGVVEQAGVYIDAKLTKKVHVEKGLGSRHVAAAAVTAQCPVLAIVISESPGTVTVFSEGTKVMAINRPRQPV